MEFTKLNAPTLKELFVQELENRILSGKLEIGSQLPSERELAEMMQVSRTVVNSGISEMAKKGFLVIKPRIGTFVSDYRRNGTLETFISIMNYNGGMLKKSEIKSILEVRMVLDTLAVELVLPKITSEEMMTLKAYLESLRDAKTAEEAAKFAYEFHHELSVISGNTFLPLLFSSSMFPICSLWERFCRIHGIDALYQNNAQLYNALENRNLSGAVKCVKHNMQETINGSRQIYTE